MNVDFTFDATLKKKKKTPIEKPILEEGNQEKPETEVDLSLTATKPKTKKVIKKVVKKSVKAAAAAAADDDDDSAAAPAAPSGASDAEQDQLYMSLHNRFREMFEAEHPDSETKLLIPPPAIGRDGKKTIWSNFGETAAILGRSEEHFSAYVFAELSATGSINEKRQLIFKAGKFTVASLMNVTRQYHATYVKCKSCGSSKTHFAKQDRMDFVVCDVCASRRHVNAISRGFEAVLKRKK